MKTNKPKIAIFGAGIAGLSCAYFLKNDGYDVTVYEKGQRLAVDLQPLRQRACI